MTDLDKLIAAVEARDEIALYAALRAISSAAHDKGEYWPAHDATKAFDGSLDSAHRLHEALLPGWAWSIECANAAEIWPKGVLTAAVRAYADGGTPARAWLLAILRALKAQGGDA